MAEHRWHLNKQLVGRDDATSVVLRKGLISKVTSINVHRDEEANVALDDV
jgi:hypothetical protein